MKPWDPSSGEDSGDYYARQVMAAATQEIDQLVRYNRNRLWLSELRTVGWLIVLLGLFLAAAFAPVQWILRMLR